MLSEEKKRGLLRPREEIQDRPRATKVLKCLYQTTFAWKTKGLWMTRDENHPQNCQTQASSLCTVSSLLHWQCIKLLPSVGRWLGLGGRGLSEEDMRRLLGHRGFNMHPYCKGLYQREGSPSWGSTSVHNLINVVVLSIGKYLIYLVPTGRSWVQLWVENIFIATVPVKHLSENGHTGNTKICRQSSGQRLQDPLVPNGPVGALVSGSFPAQARTSAVWDVGVLLHYFDPWTFAAVNQMMCLVVLAWCFLASKHGMVGGCKASLHFYTSFTPL